MYVPRMIVAWATNTAALWLADALWDGVVIDGWTAFLVGGAVLAVANAFVKPVLAILTLPLIIVTLGLAYLALNIAMVALAEWVAPDFAINGFWAYVGTVFVVWAVNWLVAQLFDTKQVRR